MSNICKIAFVFIGTVIGAGFASGQEIMQFFIRYGKVSYFGLLLSCFLFTLICAVVLCKINALKPKGLVEYFANFNCPWLVKLFNAVICVFMFASFCVMVAASGAVFQEQLGLPYILGVLCMCLICAGVFWFGAEGIVAINVLLTPLMIFGIMAMGLFSTVPTFAVQTLTDNFFVSSILYASYNTLTIIVIMTAIYNYVDSRKTALLASAAGGMVLCVVAEILWTLLYYGNTAGAELPMLQVAGEIGTAAKFIYMLVLYMAILTTAIANGFGVIHSIKGNERLFGILLCAAAAVVSMAGFSGLVGKVYSFFGYIGIGIMVITIIDGIKYLKK